MTTHIKIVTSNFYIIKEDKDKLYDFLWSFEYIDEKNKRIFLSLADFFKQHDLIIFEDEPGNVIELETDENRWIKKRKQEEFFKTIAPFVQEDSFIIFVEEYADSGYIEFYKYVFSGGKLHYYYSNIKWIKARY